MTSTGTDRARDAFGSRRWADAFDGLSAAGLDGLDPDDLERLAVAGYLVGRDDASNEAWERAHHTCLDEGDVDRAIRCAVWLGITAILRGDAARAGGWLARAQRLVDEHDPDGPSPGYLLIPASLQALQSGDAARAYDLATESDRIGRAHGDADLAAFATLSRGKAAVALGEVAPGLGLLDEAMVAVTAGEVSPIPAGIIYCAVIETCVDLFDVRRAAEWTDALSRWCATQPDLVPYRGQCLVHRSQVLQLHGEWPEAASEADRARDRLSHPPHPALGLACYQRAELHRLRGQVTDAEEAYREASRHGHEPTPGLALLRMATGNTEAAAAAIRRVLGEPDTSPDHPRTLAAGVEILLAAGAGDEAEAAAARLAELADHPDAAPLLRAMAAHARGTLRVTQGDASAALALLREAAAHWRSLGMPYEEARTRVQIASACHELGDADAADLEVEAARATFVALEAGPDLERLADATPAGPASPGGLTGRECEVLKLVAAGLTNRQIAAELTISEHTVARHVQNIFTKIGVSSRSAATAHAYGHGLA